MGVETNVYEEKGRKVGHIDIFPVEMWDVSYGGRQDALLDETGRRERGRREGAHRHISLMRH